jgi:hypothetical protein
LSGCTAGAVGTADSLSDFVGEDARIEVGCGTKVYGRVCDSGAEEFDGLLAIISESFGSS